MLLLSLSEQFADVGLRLAHILVEDLGAVDDLRLASVEHLADLPGHQCFTAAWRPKQQDALHVLTPWGDKVPKEKKEGNTDSSERKNK